MSVAGPLASRRRTKRTIAANRLSLASWASASSRQSRPARVGCVPHVRFSPFPLELLIARLPTQEATALRALKGLAADRDHVVVVPQTSFRGRPVAEGRKLEPRQRRLCARSRLEDQVTQVPQRNVLGVESLRVFVVKERYVDQLRLLLGPWRGSSKVSSPTVGHSCARQFLMCGLAHAPQCSSSRALLAHHRPPIFRAGILLFSKRKNACRRLTLSTSAMPVAPQTKSEGSGFGRVSFEGVSVDTWDSNSCCFVPRRRALTSLLTTLRVGTRLTKL